MTEKGKAKSKRHRSFRFRRGKIRTKESGWIPSFPFLFSFLHASKYPCNGRNHRNVGKVRRDDAPLDASLHFFFLSCLSPAIMRAYLDERYRSRFLSRREIRTQDSETNSSTNRRRLGTPRTSTNTMDNIEPTLHRSPLLFHSFAHEFAMRSEHSNRFQLARRPTGNLVVVLRSLRRPLSKTRSLTARFDARVDICPIARGTISSNRKV